MRYVMAITALLSVVQAWAGEVTVSNAWVRASAPGQDSAAVYLRITSQQDARLIAVTSPAADSAEMHSMTHDKGVMKMRELDALSLPAGQEVVLGSGGDHLMLLGLKKPLKVGSKVPLNFTVQFTDRRKEKIEVKAEVRSLAAGQDMHEHHQQK